MNKTIVLTGVALAFGALILAVSSESEAGTEKPAPEGIPYPPDTSEAKQLAFLSNAIGQQPSIGAVYTVRYDLNAGPATSQILKNRHELAPGASDFLLFVWEWQQTAFLARQAARPETDSLYDGPFYSVIAPYQMNASTGKPKGWQVLHLNKYGYMPFGPEGSGGLNVLDVIGMAGNAFLPYIPGYGTAANAALQGAIALGKGQSLKDAAMAAARGALPPWGQVAFDLGVGIANGKPVDSAAKEAALNYLDSKYPSARQAYEEGKNFYD